MIGQDSTALRVDLSAARRIIDYVGEADSSSSSRGVPEDDAVKRRERQRSVGEMEGGADIVSDQVRRWTRLKHCCVHCVSPFTNNYVRQLFVQL